MLAIIFKIRHFSRYAIDLRVSRMPPDTIYSHSPKVLPFPGKITPKTAEFRKGIVTGAEDLQIFLCHFEDQVLSLYFVL